MSWTAQAAREKYRTAIRLKSELDITVFTFLKTAKALNDDFFTFEDEQKAHLVSAEA